MNMYDKKRYHTGNHDIIIDLGDHSSYIHACISVYTHKQYILHITIYKYKALIYTCLSLHSKRRAIGIGYMHRL